MSYERKKKKGKSTGTKKDCGAEAHDDVFDHNALSNKQRTYSGSHSAQLLLFAA